MKILLYYKYVPLENPETICAAQKTLCQSLDLKGRILVSSEGINGTLAGEEQQVNEYIQQTKQIPEFSDMEWKVSWSNEQVFPKLRVAVRDEIVTLGIKKTGKDVVIANKADYIQPDELQALYENNEEFVIVDARNAYESSIGKFKNAVVAPIDNFRDFPEFAQKVLNTFKNKQVVTYCTGGVRCEKASAYLRENGFENVRQLHGGIHEYGEQTGGKYFEGEMFVFDKRLHVPVNTVEPTVISHCIYCNEDSVNFIDCVAPGCDGLVICCQQCQKAHQSACSSQCEQKIVSAQ